MERRNFLTLFGLLPAMTTTEILLKKEPPKDGVVLRSVPYCSLCGYAIWVPTTRIISCGNHRCRNYGVEYRYTDIPLERV